jgi:hypothetical protein
MFWDSSEIKISNVSLHVSLFKPGIVKEKYQLSLFICFIGLKFIHLFYWAQAVNISVLPHPGLE